VYSRFKRYLPVVCPTLLQQECRLSYLSHGFSLNGVTTRASMYPTLSMFGQYK